MKNDFYNMIEDSRESGGYDKDKIAFLVKEVGGGHKILDVACNDGLISEILKKNNNDVYGFDTVHKNIQVAIKRGIKARCFHIGSGPLPYPKKEFDIVILGDILEHIFDTDNLLRECYRVLKPKGKLIVTTPNVASFARRVMLLVGISPFLEYSLELTTNHFPSVGHIRYYTVQTLRQQLKYHKFTPKKVVGNGVYFTSFFRYSWLGSIFPSLSSILFAVAEKDL